MGGDSGNIYQKPSLYLLYSITILSDLSGAFSLPGAGIYTLPQFQFLAFFAQKSREWFREITVRRTTTSYCYINFYIIIFDNCIYNEHSRCSQKSLENMSERLQKLCQVTNTATQSPL